MNSIDLIVKKFNECKEQLLKDRLKSLGLDLNAITQDRRFPLLKYEFDNEGTERVYYNDGSKYGRLVITFYKVEEDWCGIAGHKEIIIRLKYR